MGVYQNRNLLQNKANNPLNKEKVRKVRKNTCKLFFQKEINIHNIQGKQNPSKKQNNIIKLKTEQTI